MEVNRSLAQTRFNLTRKPGRAVTHIVCHYTATNASAESNCRYFGGGDRGSSADFFIDLDGSVWQFNADYRNYYSWHCGCSSNRTRFVTNARSVGIEMVGTGARFTDAQRESLRRLVTSLMDELGVPASNVVRHYDCNTVHKLCPHAYCGNAAKDAAWDELKAYITTEEDDDEVKPEDIQAVAKAVWGYCNERFEEKDAYQILRDLRDDQPRAVWGYRNEELEEGDAYQMLRDVRDAIDDLAGRVAAIEGAAGGTD